MNYSIFRFKKGINLYIFTGKSVSDALILESVNQQYDERLLVEFQEKYKFATCCVQKLVIFVFVLTFETTFVQNML